MATVPQDTVDHHQPLFQALENLLSRFRPDPSQSSAVILLLHVTRLHLLSPMSRAGPSGVSMDGLICSPLD